MEPLDWPVGCSITSLTRSWTKSESARYSVPPLRPFSRQILTSCASGPLSRPVQTLPKCCNCPVSLGNREFGARHSRLESAAAFLRADKRFRQQGQHMCRLSHSGILAGTLGGGSGDQSDEGTTRDSEPIQSGFTAQNVRPGPTCSYKTRNERCRWRWSRRVFAAIDDRKPACKREDQLPTGPAIGIIAPLHSWEPERIRRRGHEPEGSDRRR